MKRGKGRGPRAARSGAGRAGGWRLRLRGRPSARRPLLPRGWWVRRVPALAAELAQQQSRPRPGEGRACRCGAVSCGAVVRAGPRCPRSGPAVANISKRQAGHGEGVVVAVGWDAHPRPPRTTALFPLLHQPVSAASPGPCVTDNHRAMWKLRRGSSPLRAVINGTPGVPCPVRPVRLNFNAVVPLWLLCHLQGQPTAFLACWQRSEIRNR